MSKDAGGANAFVCIRIEHARALHVGSQTPIYHFLILSKIAEIFIDFLYMFKFTLTRFRIRLCFLNKAELLLRYEFIGSPFSYDCMLTRELMRNQKTAVHSPCPLPPVADNKSFLLSCIINLSKLLQELRSVRLRCLTSIGGSMFWKK